MLQSCKIKEITLIAKIQCAFLCSFMILISYVCKIFEYLIGKLYIHDQAERKYLSVL